MKTFRQFITEMKFPGAYYDAETSQYPVVHFNTKAEKDEFDEQNPDADYIYKCDATIKKDLDNLPKHQAKILKMKTNPDRPEDLTKEADTLLSQEPRDESKLRNYNYKLITLSLKLAEKLKDVKDPEVKNQLSSRLKQVNDTIDKNKPIINNYEITQYS